MSSCRRQIGAGFSSTLARSLARSLALSLAVIGLAAAAEVSVQVLRQDKAVQVEAKLMVALEQRVAWQVLSDHDKLASFVPKKAKARRSAEKAAHLFFAESRVAC